jgi:hypothetical protein
MKSWLSFLALMLCASVALAEPPAPTEPPQTESQKKASDLVSKELVTPLRKSEKKRAKFSRVMLPPSERRVRVLDEQAQTDVRGKQFLRFAIDERAGWRNEREWNEDSVLGCVYLEEDQVYVQAGDSYVHARSKLGKGAKAQDGVCRSAQVDPATLAQR